MAFTERDVPDQRGRTVLVTGANSGLGWQSSRILASRGARVLMACRDPGRGEAALGRLLAAVPGGRAELVALDLADLASVEAAAADVAGRVDRLDVLLNNAGVMAVPRRETADGFELQLGTNHLGHFALTGRLLPLLLHSSDGRVVTTSSVLHALGSLDFDDLQSRRHYRRWRAYGRSKLANLLFAYELQRRLVAAGAPVVSATAHPGYAATHLQAVGPDMSGPVRRVLGRAVMQLGNLLLAQSDAAGALPQVYAATMPDVTGGDHFGPAGPAGLWGGAGRAPTTRRARDEVLARRLWDVSTALTGVAYDLPLPAGPRAR